MHFVLIGNPENRRCSYFVAAVQSQGYPPPTVVSWLDILNQTSDWTRFLEGDCCLRIESSGENFEVGKQLLALGAGHPSLGTATTLSATDAHQLPQDFGRLQYLRQQHLGFEIALQQIQEKLHHFPQLRLMNSIESILLSFDKINCHRHLSEQDVKMPPAIYEIKSYDDLRAKMQERSWTRVFIKPNGGSSASGVVAYRVQGQREQAISSVELQGTGEALKFYNALKVSTYEKEKEIRPLIDFLAKESVIVEKWMPKASLPSNAVFDFRILVIKGKAMHAVVRTSRSPMTNLHLGNQRGDLDEVIELIGKDRWQMVCSLAEQAVQAMPNMHYAGVDVMLSNHSDFRNAYLLEVNAFGDLLPHVLLNGMDSYTTEVYML